MLKSILGAAALAAAALSAACSTVPGEAAAVPAVPARFTVTVEGEGPDVILIPGLASPRQVWDGARAALDGKYRLHLVQLNGFGGSAAGANPKVGILPSVVEELSHYIASKRLKPVRIVGHSMGGLIGLMFARAHPEQVRRLMIVDALPFIGALFDPDATVQSLEPRAAAFRDMIRTRAAAPRPSEEEAAAGAAGMSRSAEGRAQVGRWSLAADQAVVAQAVYETMTSDLRSDLPSIRVPITMLYPWDEGSVSEAQARPIYENAYKAAPNAKLVAVPNSQHFIMIDQPAIFAEQLRAFLSENPDRP